MSNDVTGIDAAGRFDYPLISCDFTKWCRFDSLPIEQACFVLMGYEPPPLSVLRARQVLYQERRLPTWEKPQGFDDVLGTIRCSVGNGSLQSQSIVVDSYQTNQLSWPALLTWAGAKGYVIPHQLKLSVVATTPTPAPVEPATDGPAPRPAKPNWKMLVQAEATELFIRLLASGANPTAHSIRGPMAKWCQDNDIRTDGKNGGINPSENYLRTWVLGGKHWAAPSISREQAKKHVAQVAQAKAAQVAH